jgi:hypothetical protein
MKVNNRTIDLINEEVINMRMVKILFIVSMMAFLLVPSYCPAQGEKSIRADDFSLYYVPGKSDFSIERFIVENDPPIVLDAFVKPSSPGVNDPVSFEANIRNNPELTQSETIEAKVYYSLDDGVSWTKVDMDQNADLPAWWRADIPAVGKPCVVRYFFTAKDDAGNMLIELPEAEIVWGGVDSPALTGEVSDENDDSRVVPDDLDIIKARVGFDGKLLYFAMQVDGKISSGTVSPYNIYVYSVGIYYSDSIADNSIRTDFVLEHAQHAQFLRLPVIGMLDTNRNLSIVEKADPRYYSDRSWLYMMFNTEMLKTKRFDKLRIIFGTAYSPSFQPEVVLKPVDTTAFLNIVRSERSFEVR